VVHDKGNAELMLGELRRLAQHGDPRDVRTRYSYQLRYALPFAPLALALVVVGVLPRANQTASLRMAMAAILCGGYYVLLMAGTMTLAQGTATAVVSAAWLPNVACVLLAGVVLTARLARLAGDPPQMVARMTP
jgi:lipopolysaccharide export LptBFGC system permease protein LptF